MTFPYRPNTWHSIKCLTHDILADTGLLRESLTDIGLTRGLLTDECQTRDVLTYMPTT